MTGQHRALLERVDAFLAEHYRGPGVDELRAEITRTLNAPATTTPARADDPDDPRFTGGLLHDVLTVLEAHGYRGADDDHSYAYVLVALRRLCLAFEGGGR